MSSPPDLEFLVLADTGTLSPLPPGVKAGVIAMGICGLLSFTSCGALFLYVSYRLLRSRQSRSEGASGLELQDGNISNQAFDVAGATSVTQTNKTLTPANMDNGALGSGERASRNKPDANSFLTLIHNLLMADMLQACAFLVSVTWWRTDGIYVPTVACGARKIHLFTLYTCCSAFLSNS